MAGFDMIISTPIQSSSSTMATLLAPCHIISYATLLGTTLFQTFVNTKVCYNELPKTAFTTLQKRLFPIYFRCQSILLVVTALTFPPSGPASLLKDKRDWVAFAIAGITAILNLFIYGPRTKQAMIDRIHQGKLATQNSRTSLMRLAQTCKPAGGDFLETMP
ncbi:hypothetical protein CCHR01_04401 [Colletotrichum chrysophilum]|uniref:TMEM205-like domain-containing protein n=1 Tax=Colletotrichum chrysophilum TaxID=1836956 RepID=A0AAD9AR52_9PEZI|nr:hypothetical protein CCHR01_04401 [Colletotrichum chrysophilum]